MAGREFISARNAQVAGATSLNVKVEGLADLRRAVKAVDKSGLTAIREILKDASQIIATDARTLAPRKSGKLIAGIQAATSGNKALVRDRVPYAALIHWGGSTGRGHASGAAWSGATVVKPSLFISRAIDRNEETIANHLASEFDSLIRRSGWD